MNKGNFFFVSGLLILLFAAFPALSSANLLTPMEGLGKSIFFDENLSINRNQSCATCHMPNTGFTGTISDINLHGAVYEGSISGRFGERKPPTAAYATTSPIFHFDGELWIGGNFWDGRATGAKLGNPAADQAQGPFLNPVEQALSDSACVVFRVCEADYPVDFTDVYPSACDITWPADVDTACESEGVTIALSPEDRMTSDAAYDLIALAVAEYEDSPEVNSFSSRWDYARLNMARLNKEERRGFALFQGKGKCKACHVTQGEYPLFTDYSFDNLGIPINPENPAYISDPTFRDSGLGGFLMSDGYDEEVYMLEWGKHKVPTLRNVDVRPDESFVKAYGHNGYFKSLEGIVHFYNTRDVLPVCPGVYTEAQALAANCWPAPEIPVNVNTAELGNLGLIPEEEAAIVAYMKTLNDGHVPWDVDPNRLVGEALLLPFQLYLPVVVH